MEGSYKGEMETAYIVNAQHRTRIKRFIKAEESILHLSEQRGADQHRMAELEYMKDGVRQHLGKFEQITETEAQGLEAWTKDLSTGIYYTAKI